SQMHGILVEGDNDFWYESGAVQDVVIRNNTFQNIGFGAANGFPLFASPKLTKEQKTGEGHYHRNIVFSGNTIRSFNGNVADAKSVENLTIENNKVEYSADYPKAKPGASVRLVYCRNVVIKNNTAVGFDAALGVEASNDCERIQVGSNTGFDAGSTAR
ncbi:MAG TPA: right-handed parallel beta-helix repeat-containing protein, partial [Oceanipulchritudo sp.]|nr:right-handed parallel beta-helix repeat-containing protein [Oceanipulchritudo sp.]